MFAHVDPVKVFGVAIAAVLVPTLILLALGKLDGWLHALLDFVNRPIRLPRFVRLDLGDAHDVEPTPGVDGEPEEVDDPERVGLTLKEVVARTREADELAGMPPEVALQERMRELGGHHWRNFGGIVPLGEVRPDYEPPVTDFRDEESDETDGGSDEDRVVEPDEDNGYPRGAAAPEPVPPFAPRWDVNEEQVPDWTYNAMGAVPAIPAGVLDALEAPTGSWKLYDRNTGSVPV